VALCYTADLNSPAEDLYTLDYYLRLAEKMVNAGAHIIAIKDMAGLLRPPAPESWSPHSGRTSISRAPAYPRHGGWPACDLIAAIEVGVDAVDVASAPMAGNDEPGARLRR
jgi:pyruvate carboxylase